MPDDGTSSKETGHLSVQRLRHRRRGADGVAGEGPQGPKFPLLQHDFLCGDEGRTSSARTRGGTINQVVPLHVAA
jgi:hypothetical protein